MPIVLFATSACPHCEQGRQFLGGRGVIYKELDPSTDRAVLRRMLELTGRATVPTLAVGRDVMMGFDAAQWGEMLDRA
jgi:glutaredoxin 3